MTAPYSVTNNNTNKCPHGFPIGTCPICSGMSGGVSKDKNKPRVPGEMSYNECMAEWRRIQAEQNAKLQDKIDKRNAILHEMFSSKPLQIVDKIAKFQNKLMDSIDKLPKIISTPLKFVTNIVLNATKFIFNTLNNIQNFVLNVKENLTNLMSSIAEKLPAVLGEIKNFINQSIENLITKPIKQVLNLFIGNSKKDNKDDKRKEKVKKVIRKIISIFFKENEEKDDNEDSKTK